METFFQKLSYFISLFITVLYTIIYASLCKKMPDLKNIVILLTSILAIYLSSLLIVQIILVADSEMGILKDQKIIIIVGCFSLLYVTVVQLIQVVQELIKDKQKINELRKEEKDLPRNINETIKVMRKRIASQRAIPPEN